MEIFLSPLFMRQLKKLPGEIRVLALQRAKLFAANPHDPRLKTHKLTGRMEGYSAFSVNYSYRIIFDIIKDETEPGGRLAQFLQIGDHDIYD